MKKELSEMTLQELWELFPIILVKHNDLWKEQYEVESNELKKLLSDFKFRIFHIGSTAIDNIMAKPIVDILVVAKTAFDMANIGKILCINGYRCICEDESRIDFNKGYTEDGFSDKVFHLHLRQDGDCDELYFRDYMNDNPDLASEYEKLKLSLWKKYEHDRDGYTDAKGSFIGYHTRLAKALYDNRYKTMSFND